MCHVGTGKCLTSGPLNCVLPHGVKSAGRQCPVIRCQELANDRFESKEPHLLFGDFFFTQGVFPNACRHPSLACGGTQAYLGARMIKTVIARLAPASQPGQFFVLCDGLPPAAHDAFCRVPARLFVNVAAIRGQRLRIVRLAAAAPCDWAMPGRRTTFRFSFL